MKKIYLYSQEKQIFPPPWLKRGASKFVFLGELVSSDTLNESISGKNSLVEELTNYNVVDYVSALYKNNIIKEEQVKSINTSRIRIGDIEYAKNNYEMDFIQTILSQREKNKNKIRVK